MVPVHSGTPGSPGGSEHVMLHYYKLVILIFTQPIERNAATQKVGRFLKAGEYTLHVLKITIPVKGKKLFIYS